MNFFSQLAGISNGLDITLRIKQKNGKLTLSVLTESPDNSGIQPLILTGIPDELDAEFFNLISAPIATTTAALINLEAHQASVANAAKDEKKPSKPAPQVDLNKDKKPDKPKTISPPLTEQKKLPEPDLFED